MVTEAFSSDFRRLVPADAVFSKVASGLTFTEGPVWNHREGYLAWVDIIGDAIWKWVPGEGKSIVMRPSAHANGMTFDREGRLVIAGWSGRTVWRIERDGSATTLASHYNGEKLNTPNDIVVKSDGSIYFTDPSNGVHLVGHQGADLQKYLDYEGVYRLNPDTGELTLLNDDMVFPNGLCFSPDESRMYVNDTTRHYIRVFDVLPDGTLGNPRHFADLHGADVGHPDGIKVDVEGNVYCTGPGGVWVMNPEGKHLGLIRTPEPCHNFTIGGEDLKTIFFACRTTIYRMGISMEGIAVCAGE